MELNLLHNLKTERDDICYYSKRTAVFYCVC